MRRQRAAIFHKGLLTPERELVEPKYSPDALEATLLKFFGDTQFSTAITPLLISSYDQQSQLSFFFKSHRISRNSSYDCFVREMAPATSAAPHSFRHATSVRPRKITHWLMAESS